MLRSGSGCKGHQDILKKRIAESHQRGLLAVLLFSLHVLTTHFVEVLQGSCDMEVPPTSERLAINRSYDVGKSVCNGLRLDDEWEYQ